MWGLGVWVSRRYREPSSSTALLVDISDTVLELPLELKLSFNRPVAKTSDASCNLLVLNIILQQLFENIRFITCSKLQ